MFYSVSKKNPTGLQLADLERFYIDHGKNGLFIDSLRGMRKENGRPLTIADKFAAIVDQLNRENCHTLVPMGIGVENRLILHDDPLKDSSSFLADVPDVPTTVSLKIWTVTICNFIQPEAMPWVSSFSSEELAEDFRAQCEEKIAEMKLENILSVTIDSSRLDSTDYLEALIQEYSDDDNEIPGF